MIKLLIALAVVVLFTRITNHLKELFPWLSTWLGNGDSDESIGFNLFGNDGDDSEDD
jgi:hypothetical protein